MLHTPCTHRSQTASSSCVHRQRARDYNGPALTDLNTVTRSGYWKRFSSSSSVTLVLSLSFCVFLLSGLSHLPPLCLFHCMAELSHSRTLDRSHFVRMVRIVLCRIVPFFNGAQWPAFLLLTSEVIPSSFLVHSNFVLTNFKIQFVFYCSSLFPALN